MQKELVFGKLGDDELDLVDSTYSNGRSASITHTCTKSGYYYIFANVTSYESGAARGTCTITRNGTAIDQSDYLFASNINISYDCMAKIKCNAGDTIVVTTQCTATSCLSNAILMLA